MATSVEPVEPSSRRRRSWGATRCRSTAHPAQTRRTPLSVEVSSTIFCFRWKLWSCLQNDLASEGFNDSFLRRIESWWSSVWQDASNRRHGKIDKPLQDTNIGSGKTLTCHPSTSPNLHCGQKRWLWVAKILDQESVTAIYWKSVLFSNKLRGSKANIWLQSHKLQELFCKLNLKSNLRLVASSASIKFYHFHTCLDESDRKSVSSWWLSSICFILDQYLIYVISIIVTSVYQVSGRQKAFSAFSVIFRKSFSSERKPVNVPLIYK